MVSGQNAVCQKNYYIAIVSTNVETKTPEKEIQIALDLVGPILEKFIKVNHFYKGE